MTDESHSGVPCMVMRGGTSKGAYFLRDDLPVASGERNDLILRIVGSPDARQIDGIGGAHPLTTKVAVINRSNDPRADVDYLYAQNCGNLLAGVGPFAVERGLVETDGSQARVRILMVNTDSVAEATFDLEQGAPRYSGLQAISGVPGTASPIRLDFDGVAGSTCGALLPTGSTADEIVGIRCTLIDCGMPVVVVRADDVGISGHESCGELEENTRLRTTLEEIRLAAGGLMGLGDVSTSLVPKITIVAPPTAGGALSTRTFIPHRCHDAIGVLGGVSVAAAALIVGTTAADVAARGPGGLVVLEHPTGTFEAVLDLADAGPDTVVERAGIVRTARKLMDGTVFPRDDL